jgi:CRISPR-associated protein Cmr3
MFEYLISVNPLGFLYGSRGAFLSPENLVGRSGAAFPPPAIVVIGLLARVYPAVVKQTDLRVAGAFWAESHDLQNFWVPTPFNLLVRENKVVHQLVWDGTQWKDKNDQQIMGKFSEGTWLSIRQWKNPQTVRQAPWQYIPHLHPRLAEDQRIVQGEDRRTLFLENAVQLSPDARLIYLSSHPLPTGWYRFGGEGHIAEVQSIPLAETSKQLFSQPLGSCFALICCGIWGSSRQSKRFPDTWQSKKQALLTSRPIPFRYRLGERLSRGHYAVPAGSVYVLNEPLQESWEQLDENIFPHYKRDGYKKWGCGLALPVRA